jgi:hypothetical protein
MNIGDRVKVSGKSIDAWGVVTAIQEPGLVRVGKCWYPRQQLRSEDEVNEEYAAWRAAQGKPVR